MPMKVTISIKGDAIIYEEPDLWHVVFITDQCHDLKLSVDGGRPESLRSPAVVRYLTIVPYNPVKTLRELGTNSDKILNLSDPKLHDVTSGKSNLFTMQNCGNGREIIHLAIPFGKVSGESLVSDYWYETYPGGARKDMGHEIATVVKVAFELNSGPGLSIIVSDKNGSKTMSYRYKSKLELDFDNDCRGASSDEDFLHYYDWVCDKRSVAGTPIRFIAGKKITKTLKNGKIIMSATGNCDPVTVRPRPS